MNPRKTVIGYLIAKPGNQYEITYETACWYTIHEIDPGCYPVYEYRGRSGSHIMTTENIPTTITKDYTPSGFGGVYYPKGDYRTGERSGVRVSACTYSSGRSRGEFTEWEHNGLVFKRIIPTAPALWQYHKKSYGLASDRRFHPDRKPSFRTDVYKDKLVLSLPAPRSA